MIRILIGDDNLQMSDTLRRSVEQDADRKVCGETVNGGDAVQRAKETNPDLIILDFQMPVMNGLQAAFEIAKVTPDVPVLLRTANL